MRRDLDSVCTILSIVTRVTLSELVFWAGTSEEGCNVYSGEMVKALDALKAIKKASKKKYVAKKHIFTVE